MDLKVSRNGQVKMLADYLLGIHHAGMLREDRLLVERMFEAGRIKILCCTATLAWGVNLPAYAVLIKGTNVYDASVGAFKDLSILDVIQIFGRAGRPQYEDHGVGYILTASKKIPHYVSLLTNQLPIESKFILNLVNNLNAEICLGTVTNIEDAVIWLSYTYLYIRMLNNPLCYGIEYSSNNLQNLVIQKCKELIKISANTLHEAKMIIYDAQTGILSPNNLGRIASQHYFSYESIEIINLRFSSELNEMGILRLVSTLKEFSNVKFREEEVKDLEKIRKKGCIYYSTYSEIMDHTDKVVILIECYMNRVVPNNFSLVSDYNYVVQNVGRIFKGIFEIALDKKWDEVSEILLEFYEKIQQ